MKAIFTGQASKFLVAIMGAVSSSLTLYYGNEHWVPIVVSAIAAIGVYLVPNSSSTTPVEPPK